jgi:RimJ/RimL family protein N-acetyltransferase
MIGAMEIVTPRLLLREFHAADHQAVHEYAADPAVTRFMDWGPNTPAETVGFLAAVRAEAADVPRSAYSLAIVVRTSSELIGSVRIAETSRVHRRGEMGYVLAQSHWGQGYATEAAAAALRFGFADLGLHRICATCDPDNVASARVLTKVGMRLEGHLHEHLFIRGEWRDRLTFAALSPALTRAAQ